MKKTLGNDFSIKAEGIIDNILVAISLMERDLQEQLAYAIKQFDPETAEGEYQDALYERVALYRNEGALTSFTITISGLPGTYADIGELYIKSSENGEYFQNTTSVEFDENGLADVVFSALYFANVTVDVNDNWKIITKPENIIDIDFKTIRNVKLGNKTETDFDFRKRFHSIKGLNKKCTRNAILENLSKYTGGMEFISIQDCNSDDTIPAGTILITAKPTVTDEKFAKHILDNVIAGVDFMGNTTVAVPLSNGQTWDVKFQKATEVLIDLYIEIKIKSGYYENVVGNKIRDNIHSYLETHILGLETSIRATEFIVPTLEIEGVDAVTNILIKRNDSATYTSSVTMGNDEYPSIVFNNINIQNQVSI